MQTNVDVVVPRVVLVNIALNYMINVLMLPLVLMMMVLL